MEHETESESRRSAGEMDKETFITTLRGGAPEKSENKTSMMESINGMGRVQELHSQLTGVVGSLSEKVAGVLKKQEEEFLSAYRAHMYNVQKELQELRAKVKNAELALQRDEQIRQLTQERDWFRKEALRLDSYSTSMKKELKFLEEKLESVDEDRSWLEKQLKSAKKQNKLLRTELELHLEDTQQNTRDTPCLENEKILQIEYQEPKPSSAGKDKNKKVSGNGNSSKLVPIRNAAVPELKGFPQMKNSSSQGTVLFGHGQSDPTETTRSKSSMGHYSMATGSNIERGGSKTSLFSHNVEVGTLAGSVAGDSAPSRHQVRVLREQLRRERDIVKDLRAAIVSDQSARSELEDFFMECIDDIKKEIARRKNKAKVSSQKRMSKVGDEIEIPTDKESRLIQLREFSAVDRRKVMEKLLLKDDVVDLLHQAVFPPPQNPAENDNQINSPSSPAMSPLLRSSSSGNVSQDIKDLLQQTGKR